MKYTVINHKEVKNDVYQAKEYYKSKQAGLEKRFATQVKTTINYFIKNPLLFQEKYKDVRIKQRGVKYLHKCSDFFEISNRYACYVVPSISKTWLFTDILKKW